MKLNDAMLEAIGVDPPATRVSSTGALSASSSKIVAELPNRKKKQFFVKTGKGEETAIMFEGSC